MSEVIQRTNGEGVTWRELSPLSTRVPPSGPANVAAPCPCPWTVPIRIAAERGERMATQEYRATDGTVRRAELPEISEPGVWRELSEDGRRLMAFVFVNGGRRCYVVH